MSNSIFVFESNEVEVFEFNGEILFNPKHVAKCLELSDSGLRNHLATMNENQAVLLKNSTVLNKDIRKLNNTGEKFLKEAGVYKLIFKSHKPSAERFQDWVTDEVLPQIRQTGGYIPTSEGDTEEEIMAKALLIAHKTIDRQKERIANLQPKADIYDTFVDNEATFGFRELRKQIESALGITIKENDFKEVLRNEFKWIGKSIKGLANAIRDGCMVTKDILDRNNNARTQDRFTMKAREELLAYYKNLNEK